MEVNYKFIHVVPKLFEGLFVWFEIYIAIHLVVDLLNLIFLCSSNITGSILLPV